MTESTVEKAQIERLISETIKKLWELWDLDEVHESFMDEAGYKAAAEIEFQRLVSKIELQLLEEIKKETESWKRTYVPDDSQHFLANSYNYGNNDALALILEFLERKMAERRK